MINLTFLEDKSEIYSLTIKSQCQSGDDKKAVTHPATIFQISDDHRAIWFLEPKNPFFLGDLLSVFISLDLPISAN